MMAEQWNEFVIKVMSSDAPAIQKQEMRRAFYAGAQAILFKVIDSFAPESEPTEVDLQLMQDVHDELQDFAKLVASGRA